MISPEHYQVFFWKQPSQLYRREGAITGMKITTMKITTTTTTTKLFGYIYHFPLRTPTEYFKETKTGIKCITRLRDPVPASKITLAKL